MNDVKNKQGYTTERQQRNGKDKGKNFHNYFRWLWFAQLAYSDNVQNAVKQLPEKNGKKNKGQESKNTE